MLACWQFYSAIVPGKILLCPSTGGDHLLLVLCASPSLAVLVLHVSVSFIFVCNVLPKNLKDLKQQFIMFLIIPKQELWYFRLKYYVNRFCKSTVVSGCTLILECVVGCVALFPPFTLPKHVSIFFPLLWLMNTQRIFFVL